MIYCPQCGNPNFDDANFCDTCGEPLVNADQYAKMQNAAQMQQVLEAQRQQREAQVYNKAYRKAQKEAKKAAKKKGGKTAGVAGAVGGTGAGVSGAGAANVGTAGASGTAGAGAQAGASGFTGTQNAAAAGAAAGAAAAGAPEDFALYKHGCLAQAWDDITETKGWAPKIVALGIVNMVPILNFFVSGYAMKWAAQLPHDKVEPMPQKIFSDGVFSQGFYAFVIALVVGFVSGVASGLLALIPILGAICGVAISLFATMLQSLSIMRVAATGKLGGGFQVKSIWNAITGRNAQFGKLFCATVLPGIIIGAAIVFVCGSVLIIFGLNSLTALYNEFQSAQQAQLMQQQLQNSMFGSMFGDMYSMSTFGYDPWAMVASMALELVPLFFVLYLIAMFLLALNSVLTLRATSHYITRYCPDWRGL